jgi:hypothetical protein
MKFEPGWQIEEPSPVNPCNVAANCVFQHNAGQRRVTVTIDNDLFRHGKLEEIQKIVRTELDRAPRPVVKILIELSSEDYEFLLNRTTEESPVDFRLKNAVKN